MKLTIDMPWARDLTVNHMRFGARGGYRKKPHVQAWIMLLAWDFRGQHIDGLRRGCFRWLDTCRIPIGVAVDFRWPDKRRRDTHNYFKVICDAVAAGLGIDDKDIRISTRSVMVDRENPGFTIEVSDAL